MESVSCVDENDGSIEININQTNHTYRLNISPTNQSYVINVDNNHQFIIDGLTPGKYELQFTVDGKSNYEQRFDIEIKSPSSISAKTSVDKINNKLLVNLFGSKVYSVNINGNTFFHDKQSLELNLKKGLNIFSVKTDKPCQGELKREIFIGEKVEFYPNPTQDYVNLYIHGEDKSIDILVFDRDGNTKGVFQEKIEFNRKVRVNLESCSKGVYMIQLKGNTVEKTIKIIKE